ncbi:putative CD48 antigen-like [Triplophysa rosa]|uniref:CD48 antigen-like n=1 Tax=Triplophysa rosa TaxID=992332 RepID=A0A9W7W9S3_TRIRA|nr:putative CD48 antigen-like [Triplophysa rosa]
MEGHSVTLHTHLTHIQTDDLILWMFGVQSPDEIIAEISREANITPFINERLKNHVEIDAQTGSLIITNITTQHTGLYQLEIIRNTVENKHFNVTVYVKSVSVMEGHSVTLHTHLTHIQTHDLILWMFGVQSPDEIIAEINREANKTSFINERLKNHVEIDAQTGSLIITNITTQHTGLYTAEISRNTVRFKYYNVTVYARLSVPIITRDSSQCSSSSSSSCCCVLCSVVNVSHDVSVSWYKGKSLLSSISVSDLNIRLSLPLEVEYQDTNTYRCVVNNPITNHTQHLHITQLCHTSEVVCHSCGFTEAVIRLVLSAVVGVATVAVLVYDVRSRRESPSTRL